MTTGEAAMQRAMLLENLLWWLIQRRTAEGPKDASIRNGLPNLDYGLANREWVTPALTAVTYVNYFSTALAQQRIAGFYKVADITADQWVVNLTFGLGAATQAAMYQLEELAGELQVVGYMPEAMIFQGQNTILVQVMGRTGSGAQTSRLVLGSLVAEKRGETVSGNPSQPNF